MKRILLLFCSVLSSWMVFAQNTLCVNEIMQSNINGVYIDNDFPDGWIELYNTTETDINIKNYYISNSRDINNGYRINSQSIVPAKGYLLIYCDKVGTGIHTDFRLESTDPGELFLFDNNGVEQCSFTYPAMIAPNVAYGRKSDGSNECGWQLESTPGATNKGGISTTLLPDPIFNISGKVLDEPVFVDISLPNGEYPDDTKIYYTTDGSEPTKESNSGTKVVFNIDKTTVIRAKTISNYAISPLTTTNTYIFPGRQINMPIIAISTDNDYLFGEENGILSSSIVDGIPNYGQNWRRPMNVEYYAEANHDAMFNQVGEIAVAGGASRSYEQKSLKLFANKRFNNKRFIGQMWNYKPSVKENKSFMLRNGGNNAHRSRINDALAQRLFGRHMDNVDYQEYRPAIVYINGVYRGYYGLRERSNEDYVYANYDKLEDFETATQSFYYNSRVRQTSMSFQNLYKLYTSDTSTYEQLSEVIDVDNFMKTLIAEIFATNDDYPNNNISMWRPNTEDGKWRWILKDLDRFITDKTPVTFNMFEYLFNPNYENISSVIESNKIYQKMMSFPEFREAFISNFLVCLGDFLKPSVTLPIVQEMRNEIIQEIELTEQAWNMVPGRLESFTKRIDSIYNKIQIRPRIVYDQMSHFFSLGKVIPLSVKTHGAPVSINGISLTEGDFDGATFSEWPMTLSSGRGNTGWEMTLFAKQNGEMVPQGEPICWTDSDLSLTMNQYQNYDSIAFSAVVLSPNDFQKKLEELCISADDCKDWSLIPSFSLEEPVYAYANISGFENLPEIKNDNLHGTMEFYDNNGNRFVKKVLVNRQGSSEKKINLSITICEDEWVGNNTSLITFGEWVPQDEFHLKAYHEDGIRGTSVIANQLYGQITEKKNGFPKAFPMSLYIDGDFYGIMSWQLKKHRDNMGLEKKNSSNVWLDGTLNDKQLFQGSINWTKFEVRNPKDLSNMDGSDYDGDNPLELMDDTSSAFTGKNKHLRSAEVKQHIIDLSNYDEELATYEAGGATIEQMRNAIQQRFDVEGLVNYMVFSLIANNYDGFSKNWQWFSFDGENWSVAPYDCNLTFGYNEDGLELWPASQSSKKYDYRMSNVDLNGPMKWIRSYFWDEVKSRYSTLRDNKVIDADQIILLFSRWINRIGIKNYDEEWRKWTESPIRYGEQESLDRIKKWIEDRINLDDIFLGYKVEPTTYNLEISEAEWATVCVPFDYQIPDQLNLYTVIDIESDDKTIDLVQESSGIANKPYLVNGPKGSYLLTGNIVIGSPSEKDYLKNGLLWGTQTDIFAPMGSYVLQNNNDLLAFYLVDSETTIPITAYHAYLMTNDDAGRLLRFRINDDVYVRSIDSDNNNIPIRYNYIGVRVSEDYKGFIIYKK